jgi:hypothetical protein
MIEGMPLGAEPADHLAAINEFLDAGFDHVYVHQVGPKQDEFFRFFGEKVLPHLAGARHRGNDKKRKNRDQKGDSDSSGARG